MRRVVVIGPHPPRVSFSGETFAHQLGERLDVHVTALQTAAETVLAAPGSGVVARTAGSTVDAWLPAADTLIWLNFTPNVYVRDWITGVLDCFLNGGAARRRRPARARLTDIARALLASLLPAPVDPWEIAERQPELRVVELNTPAQARFWLRMNEARQREQRQARR